MIGAFGGGSLASYFSGQTLLIFFGLMMLTTSIFMWKGKKQVDGTGTQQSAAKIFVEGLVVGAVTGLVGAGGGFLVVPALVLLGGLPMKRAVGTSLVVIAFKSFAGFAGYATHVSIDWTLAAVLSAGAIAGAYFGVQWSQRVDARKLRKGFAVFVAVMAVWVLVKELVIK